MIRGSTGEISCSSPEQVSLFNFNTKETVDYDTLPTSSELNTRMKNHGYADFYLMDAFIRAVSYNDPNLITTNANDALSSHELVFHIERSRLQEKIIRL